MDDVIYTVQGGTDRQQQVFDSTVLALKWLPPSLLGEAKAPVSVKKILDGEGYWECIKDVLGWIIDTKAGTVAFLERKLQELRELLDNPISQRSMGQKDLERLVGKLLSMHLACAVPGGDRYGLAVSSLPPRDRGLENSGGSDRRPAHSSHRGCPSRTHPYGVLRRLRTQGRDSLAVSISLRE